MLRHVCVVDFHSTVYHTLNIALPLDRACCVRQSLHLFFLQNIVHFFYSIHYCSVAIVKLNDFGHFKTIFWLGLMYIIPLNESVLKFTLHWKIIIWLRLQLCIWLSNNTQLFAFFRLVLRRLLALDSHSLKISAHVLRNSFCTHWERDCSTFKASKQGVSSAPDFKHRSK